MPDDPNSPPHSPPEPEDRRAKGHWTSGQPPLRRPRSLEVGQRILAARSNKGWTQAQLAEKIGKSRGTVVQYEQGNIEPPLKQIELLGKALDVVPEHLAFGRQGVTGLGEEAARLSAFIEVRFAGRDEQVSGAFGLPEKMVAEFGLDPEHAKAIVLEHAAPAFGLSAGDRVLINMMAGFGKEDRMYVLRSERGVRVVRLLPNLSTRSDVVKINDGRGETHSYERSELDVIGEVVAVLRAV